MKCKQIASLIMAVMLVFVVVVSPTLAAETGSYEVVKGGASDNNEVSDDNNDAKNNDDSVTDKILSDDKFLGFDRNKDYDLFDDMSLQKAIDLASSLPVWALFVICILLLVVVVLGMIVIVILYNTYKGGKAATGDNPTMAAKGIKDSKMVTREYMYQVAEAAGCLVCLGFAVALFT